MQKIPHSIIARQIVMKLLVPETQTLVLFNFSKFGALVLLISGWRVTKFRHFLGLQVWFLWTIQDSSEFEIQFNTNLELLKVSKLKKKPKLGISSPSLLPATFCKVLFNWSDANFRPKSLLLVLYSIKLVIHPSFGSFFPSHKSGQQLFYAVLKSRLENASSDQNFQTIESDNNAVMLW